MKPDNTLGKVVTFYSYKGGVGRSMALANVAFIIAYHGKRVLVLDWDLHAPGLHRYFSPFLTDKRLSASDGLIDLVIRYGSEAVRPPVNGESVPHDWHLGYADLAKYTVSLNRAFPSGGCVHFIPPGRQDPTYAIRQSTFDWQNFCDRLGGIGFLNEVIKKARSEYDYILIDSLTGESDTAGICTIQLPDILVLCFTVNNQNLDGSLSIAHKVRNARSKHLNKDEGKNSVEPKILPVPMRLSKYQRDKFEIRRDYAWQSFNGFVDPTLDMKKYWCDVEIHNNPYLAYEEVLAVFNDEPTDQHSLLASLIRLTSYIVDFDINPSCIAISTEDRAAILKDYGMLPVKVAAMAKWELLTIADSVYDGLLGEGKKEMRRLWLRFVHLDEKEAVNCVSVQDSLDMHGVSAPVIESLIDRGLIIRESDTGNTSRLKISNVALVIEWSAVSEWIQKEKMFLIWRQHLDQKILEWKANEESDGLLLHGEALDIANEWIKDESHSTEVSSTEKRFLNSSYNNASTKRRRKLWLVAVMTVITLMICAWFTYDRWRTAERERELDAISLSFRAVGHVERGDLENAISLFSKAIAMHPGLIEAYNGRGKARLRTSQYDEAICDFAHVINSSPNSAEDRAEAYYHRGSAHYEKGQFDSALQDLNSAIGHNPKLAEAYEYRAKAYRMGRNFAEALRDLKQAIELKAEFAEAFLDRSLVYLDLGQLENAISDLKQVVRLRPEGANAYFYLGEAYFKSGKYNAAKNNYELAIKKQPNFAEAFYGIGNLYNIAWTDSYNAIVNYDEAIRLNPNKAVFYVARGFLHIVNREYRKAIVDYSKSIELDSTDEQAYWGRATAYVALKDCSKAGSDCQRIREFMSASNASPNVEDQIRGLEAQCSDAMMGVVYGRLVVTFVDEHEVPVKRSIVRRLGGEILLESHGGPPLKGMRIRSNPVSFSHVPVGNYILRIRISGRSVAEQPTTISGGANHYRTARLEGVNH